MKIYVVVRHENGCEAVSEPVKGFSSEAAAQKYMLELAQASLKEALDNHDEKDPRKPTLTSYDSNNVSTPYHDFWVIKLEVTE